MLLVYADRARQGIPTHELSNIILGSFSVREEEFSVMDFYPDNFLILCLSQATRAAIFAASDKPLPADVLWFFRPWTRLAYASGGVLDYWVIIAL